MSRSRKNKADSRKNTSFDVAMFQALVEENLPSDSPDSFWSEAARAFLLAAIQERRGT